MSFLGHSDETTQERLRWEAERRLEDQRHALAAAALQGLLANVNTLPTDAPRAAVAVADLTLHRLKTTRYVGA